MLFSPQKYSIPDKRMAPFINPAEIAGYLNGAPPDKEKVREIIAKSLEKNRLSLDETATLIHAADPEIIEEIRIGAMKLKQAVYGNRVVLFAPLYIGSKCTNDCRYCGFRASNKEAVRKTLSIEELSGNITSLIDTGHKRIIAVFGEHAEYSANYIAETVTAIYSIKTKTGEIRRININAPPFSIEDFRLIKAAKIGTYQIFQETYHEETYKKYHSSGPKSDFTSRLTSLDRAQEAGIDDVGIGALFGLYDWRFEVLALVRHTNHLEACYHVGPHTISFPRVKLAQSSEVDQAYSVNDTDFMRMVAILRLAVPYTGMILTAREPAHIRDEALRCGCSQVDAGTKIGIGAYYENLYTEPVARNNDRQFEINDLRSLAAMVDELIDRGLIPSFCTACYRSGRTGEHFMEYCVPGFIENFCTPNALLTFAEYLTDYAPETLREKGFRLIEDVLKNADLKIAESVRKKIQLVLNGKRDLFY